MPALILGDFKTNHYYNCSYQRFKTKGLRVQLKNITQSSLHCVYFTKISNTIYQNFTCHSAIVVVVVVRAPAWLGSTA